MTTRITDERLKELHLQYIKLYMVDNGINAELFQDIASALDELIERRAAPDAYPALQALTEAILTKADADYMARQLDSAVAVMATRGWSTPVPWPAATGAEAAAPVDGDSRVYQDAGEPRAQPEAPSIIETLQDLKTSASKWHPLRHKPEAPAVAAGFKLVPVQRLKNARALVDRGMWTEGAAILDALIAAAPTAPAVAVPPRMTDEQLDAIADDGPVYLTTQVYAFARAIEKAVRKQFTGGEG